MVLVVLAAVALPIATVVLWRRGPGGVWRILRNLVCILLCQAFAVAAAGVLANDQYGFYNSWADLLGTQNQAPPVPTANGLVPTDGSQGTVLAISVPESAVPHKRFRVLVWVPKEYAQPQYSSVRFPVTMMMPGSRARRRACSASSSSVGRRPWPSTSTRSSRLWRSSHPS